MSRGWPWRAVALILLWPGAAVAAVPVIGCRAEGMGGRLAAPDIAAIVPPRAGQAETALGYYVAAGSLRVLAPRGWHCLDIYGSGGAQLIVTPAPHAAEELFRPGGLAGPAVVMDFINGENSGRFEVARLVARLFPADRAYVRRVIGQEVEPARAFPTGPYVQDRLDRRGAGAVEFCTPAHTTGLGTYDRVLSAERPVCGAVMVRHREFGMDARRVLVRLPPDVQRLARVIVREVEGRPAK